MISLQGKLALVDLEKAERKTKRNEIIRALGDGRSDGLSLGFITWTIQ